jgi:hypothetical protein
MARFLFLGGALFPGRWVMPRGQSRGDGIWKQRQRNHQPPTVEVVTSDGVSEFVHPFLAFGAE